MSQTTTSTEQGDDTTAVALHAIRHTLEQINTNSFLGSHAGAYTETYESLVSAYALLTKQDRGEVWEHYLSFNPKEAETPKVATDTREEAERLRYKLHDYQTLRDQLEDLIRDLPGRIYTGPLTHLDDSVLVDILRDHLPTPACK